MSNNNNNNDNNNSSIIVIDCILPSNSLVPISCPANANVHQFKKILWREVRTYPREADLSKHSPHSYDLMGVQCNGGGIKKEIFDDDKTLKEVKQFSTFIKIVPATNSKQTHHLNKLIGEAIGRSVEQLEESKDEQLQEFRTNINKLVVQEVHERESKDVYELTLYHHPPDLEPSSDLPPGLKKGKIKVCVWYKEDDGDELTKMHLTVCYKATPDTVITQVVRRLNRQTPNPTHTTTPTPPTTRRRSRRLLTALDDTEFTKPKRVRFNLAQTSSTSTIIPSNTHTQQHETLPPNPLRATVRSNRYALRICGTNQYMLAPDHPITQYKLVRACVCRSEIPQLYLLSGHEFYTLLHTSHPSPSSPSLSSSSSFTSCSCPSPSSSSSSSSSSTSCSCPSPSPNFCSSPSPSPNSCSNLSSTCCCIRSPGFSPTSGCLWGGNMVGKLKIHILFAHNLNQRRGTKVYVKLCVYHGGQSLCTYQDTEVAVVDVAGMAEWGVWPELNLDIQQIPRAAILCLSVCSGSRFRSKMLFWGNLCLFDHHNRLAHGRVVKVSLQSPPNTADHTKQLLNPLGYPDQTVGGGDGPTLFIGFETRFDRNVRFPDHKHILEYVNFLHRLDSHQQQDAPEEDDEGCNICDIERIASKDPLADLTPIEKETLWRGRWKCLENVPLSLPKLLLSFSWAERDNVSQIHFLLDKWGKVPFNVPWNSYKSIIRTQSYVNLQSNPSTPNWPITNWP
ncbi:hypothetical protein Pmani_018234, partial [Petrolisthes manimaculis]